MPTHHLSYGDFRQIARLCQAIDLGRLPTGFDLKRYLLRVLGAVARPPRPPWTVMTHDEVDGLRGELAEFQALVV